MWRKTTKSNRREWRIGRLSLTECTRTHYRDRMRFDLTLKTVFIPTVLAIGSLVGCGSADDVSPDGVQAADPDVAQTSEHVQWTAGDREGIDMTNQSQVEGYLWAKAKDGNYFPSCGVTFISKHFAITAAHCVQGFGIDRNNTVDAGDDLISVLQFDMRSFITANGNNPWQAQARLFQQSQVTGTWPNYQRNSPMACGVGYCITMADMQCRVKFRCAFPTPADNGGDCPIGVAGTDIAMLQCPNRPATYPYSHVAPTEALNAPIDIHWYHEMLNMPLYAADNVGPTGGWDHYGHYDTTVSGPFGRLNNYHYSQNRGQILPLISSQFPNGAHYKITSTGGSASWTDAFGCHGTSGSGVFQAGTTNFYGPVLTANTSATNGRLCIDPAQQTPGSQMLSFGLAAKTRVFETFVNFDR
jgi:hypothetical protein